MNIKNSKETILNQALAIFGRLGFHKTTMGDIANASKRGRRTIYTYFKNKEEVYEAVVEREIDRILESIHKEINNTPLANNKLERYIELRINSIVTLCSNYDALRLAYMNNYNWIEKIRMALDLREKEILKSILDFGISKQTFAFDDSESMVLNLSNIIKGVEFILIKENNKEATNIQIKALQRVLLNGLMA